MATQKWYKKASVQAAIVGGVLALITAAFAEFIGKVVETWLQRPGNTLLTISDVKWLGPWDTCRTAEGQTFSAAPIQETAFDPTNSVSDASPEVSTILSFDLQSNVRVKISKILVQIENFSSLPHFVDCQETRGLVSANLFVAAIDDPSLEDRNTFAAQIIDKAGRIGSVWLEKDRAENFRVGITSGRKGLYAVQGILIEYSDGKASRTETIQVSRVIAFK